MPNTVVIISGGPTGASMPYEGTTVYQWSFIVNVNGEVGVFSVWVAEPVYIDELWQFVIDELEGNPDELGGIGENDGTTEGTDDGLWDDDGGVAVASGDGSYYGDSA